MRIKMPSSFYKINSLKIQNKVLYNFVYFLMGLGIILVGSIAQNIVLTFAIMIYGIINGTDVGEILIDSDKLMEYISNNDFLFVMLLFSTIFGIITTIIVAKLLEKRKLSDLGLVKKNFIKNYGLGLLIGFIFFSIVVGLEVLFGVLKFDGFNTINIGLIFFLLLTLLGFGVQSFEEEIILRGFLIPPIGARNKCLFTVLSTSILFSLIHLFNSSFSLLSMINIALIGIILGLIYIITNNIWVVAGIHCMWNYAQGIIYGINVSGIIVSKSLLKSTSEGSELLTGGSFGAECSIFATIISLVFIGLIFLYMYKKKMIVKN